MSSRLRSSRRCGGGWYVSSIEEYTNAEWADQERRKNNNLSKRRQRAEIVFPLGKSCRSSLIQFSGDDGKTINHNKHHSQDDGQTLTQSDDGLTSSRLSALGKGRPKRDHTTSQSSKPITAIEGPDEEERLQRLKAELCIDQVLKPIDLQYKSVTRDSMVRFMRSTGASLSDLSKNSIQSLAAMGIDISLLDRNDLTAVTDVTVFDVRIRDLDSPPITVPIKTTMERIALHLDKTRLGFKERFLTPVMERYCQVVFWFCFAAFFQKADLPLFSTALTTETRNQLQLIWSMMRKSKSSHRPFYEILHVAVSHVVCLVHLQCFKGSGSILSQLWADRVSVLVYYLMTGVVHTEQTCRAISQMIFSKSADLRFPSAQAGQNNVNGEREEGQQEQLKMEIADIEGRTRPQREVQLGTPCPWQAYEFGVYLPRGSMLDGTRCIETAMQVMQRSCTFNLHKERFRFGKFPVDINPGQFEADFNVFNSEILEYEYAMAHRTATNLETVVKKKTHTASGGNKWQQERREKQHKTSNLVSWLSGANITQVSAKGGRQLPSGNFTEPAHDTRMAEARMEDVGLGHSYMKAQAPLFDPFAMEMCIASYREALKGYSFEYTDSKSPDSRAKTDQPKNITHSGNTSVKTKVQTAVRCIGKLHGSKMVRLRQCAPLALAACSVFVAAYGSVCKKILDEAMSDIGVAEKEKIIELILSKKQESNPKKCNQQQRIISTSTEPAVRNSTPLKSRLLRSDNKVVKVPNYLYSVSPMVEGTLGAPKEMRVARKWITRTLTFGEEADPTSTAKNIKGKHSINDKIDKEQILQLQNALIKRRNQLEQDIDRIDKSIVQANADPRKCSEFCDTIVSASKRKFATNILNRRDGVSFKGTLLADSAMNVVGALEKGLRKLDRRLLKVNSQLKARL